MNDELILPPEDQIPKEEELSAYLEQFEQLLERGDSTESLEQEMLVLFGQEAIEVLNTVKWLHGIQEESRSESPARTPEPATVQLPGLKSIANFGRFRVIERIGAGGNGVVFRVFDPQLHREAALKVPRTELVWQSEHERRFLQEARTAAALEHPQIIPIYEAGKVGSINYILSAYCSGPNLAIWMQKQKVLNRPINPRLAAEWMALLAEGMEYAHQQGVIHRDLKPGNILLEPEASANHGRTEHEAFSPRITDFGIAKFQSESQSRTLSGVILGTLPYMAPEQATARHDDVGVTVDIYSLGAILYEMLTGRPPLIGDSDLELLRKIGADDPPLIRTLRNGVPGDLEAICMKCLERNPNDRYPSSADLSRDLRRFLAGEHVEARPPSRINVLRKAIRKYRRPLSFFIASTILILAVCVAAMIAYSQMQISQRLAKEKTDLALSELQLRQESNRQLAASLFEQSFAKGNPHDASSGLLWLSRSLENSYTLGATALEQPLRRQIAGWKQLLPTLRYIFPHQQPVTSVVMGQAGNSLITVSSDDQARIWDIGNESLRFPPFKHRSEVTGVLVSSDEKMLATCPEDLVVRLWQTEKMQQCGADLVHDSKVLSVAFSADNSRLMTGCDDGNACLWDVSSGLPLRAPLKHENSVTCIAMSADSQKAITGCADGNGRIWDLTRDSTESVATFSHQAKIVAMKVSPNGKYILTGSEDRTAKVLDLETGQSTGLIIEHKDTVNVLGFSPDSRFIVTGGKDRVVRQTSLESGKQIGNAFEHQAEITSALFSPDGRTVMTTGKDWKVRLWDPSTGRQFGSDINCGSGVFSAVFGREGERIITGDGRGAARIWDISEIVPTERSLLKSGSIHGIAVSPQEDKILTVGYQTAQLWDAKNFQLIGSSPRFEPSVHFTKFSPNGKYAIICIGDMSGCALLCDIDSNLKDFRRFEHKQQVLGGGFTPNSKQFVTACLDRFVRIWNVEDGSLQGEPFPHPGGVTSVAVSPDGRVLVTGCEDGVVRLWDLQNRRLIESSMRHNESVWTVDFSSDGNTIVSGSFDHQVRFWDAKSGSPVRRSLDHGDVAVQSLQWNENEETLLVGNGRKEIVLWNLALNKPMAAPIPVFYGQRAFSIFPNESRWLLGCANGFVWEKKLPQPLDGTPQDITTWAKVVTGMELDESESVRPLDSETWRSLRNSLPNILQPR